MENFKISLSDLYLTEEQQISEDGYDQRGGYEYKLKVGDRRYILTYDVNKNPTKKGIKVKFFPLDDKGNEIMNPSDELLAQMQNDISNEYRLEFDEDEGAPEENVVAFQIPLSSFISFIANTIFKDSE